MHDLADEGLILDMTRAISPLLEGRDRDAVVNSMTDLTLAVIMYAHNCSKPEALKKMRDRLSQD